MDKQQLKAILLSCKKGMNVEICFLGGIGGWKVSSPPVNKQPYLKIAKTGVYTVIESKRGRGKNGSQLLTLALPATPDVPLFQIGTPNNDEIVYLVVNGTKHGVSSEAELVKTFDKDIVTAKALKEKLSPLLRLKEGTKLKLKIVSDLEPKFNGTFELLNVKAMSGRWGQIKLDLKNIETGEAVELWSYRHATAVKNVTNVTLELKQN